MEETRDLFCHELLGVMEEEVEIWFWEPDAGRGLKAGGNSPSKFARRDTDRYKYSTYSLEERLNTPRGIEPG